jgi:hypothetical protein
VGREIEAFRREVSRQLAWTKEPTFVMLTSKLFLIVKRAMPKNSNKPWTPEDDSRLLELWAAGKPHFLIGPALGRTTGAIEGRLSILNTRTVRLKRERAAEVSGD